MTVDNGHEIRVAAGRWLVKRRRAAGFSRPVDLARELGIPRSTVSSWEVGRSVPSEERIPHLADALAVDQEEVRRAYGLYVSRPIDHRADQELNDKARVVDLLRELTLRFAELPPDKQRAALEWAVRHIDTVRQADTQLG